MLRVILDPTRLGNRGFQVEFPNGNELSVMFGKAHYCSNRQIHDPDETGGIKNHSWASDDAEVMVRVADLTECEEQWEPMPYVSPILLADVMSICATVTGTKCQRLLVNATDAEMARLDLERKLERQREREEKAYDEAVLAMHDTIK